MVNASCGVFSRAGFNADFQQSLPITSAVRSDRSSPILALLEILQSIHPVVQLTPLIHDRKYDDHFVAFHIVNPISKRLGDKSPPNRTSLVNRRCLGLASDELQRFLHRSPKLFSISFAMTFVEVRRLFNFNVDLGVKDEPFQFAYFLRSRSIVSSAGTPFSRPLVKSSSRRASMA